MFPVLDEVNENVCLWSSKLISLFSYLSIIYALFKLKTHFVKADQKRKDHLFDARLLTHSNATKTYMN